MNSFNISSIAAFTLNLAMGVAVYTMNPQRRANRFFLITSLAIAGWVLCFVLVSIAQGKDGLLFLMRASGMSSVVIAMTFDLLRHSIVYEKEDSRHLLKTMAPWLFIVPINTIICFQLDLVTAVDQTRAGFPMPIYGAGQIPYNLLFASCVILFIKRFASDLRKAKGVQRTELGYNWVAAALLAFVGLLLAQIIPTITGERQIMQYLPLSVLMYDAILAYGIVTRRIMSVSDVLRSATAYLLLAVYLAIVYTVVYWPSAALATDLGARTYFLPHLVAALAVAFSIAPAHGRLQRVAHQLFISTQAMDTQNALRRAQLIMTSIKATDELLTRFGSFVREVSGTDRAIVLLKKDDIFSQQFPIDPDSTVELKESDSLLTLLRSERFPVSSDRLKRERPTSLRKQAAATLAKYNVSLALGIHAGEELAGVLLLAPRLSGRIYAAHEQDALQIICNQLGTSLENSQLYTAVQEGKIYNDILVDALVSGVIAVNADRHITVFNRQAKVLTGIDTNDILDRDISLLPLPIRTALENALTTREGIRDKDEVLNQGQEDEVPVRISSAVFHGTNGELLGALALLSDMRAVKQMEAQIRRSDRLSSIGTLAAGMAHEIKNPLVPIKTFTQLLPQQYDDAEFRKTFSDLVLREVGRIDSIVTRMLHFARPAPATLAPISLEAILNDSLRLLEQQMRRRGIVLKKEFHADSDQIMGDADLLSQAFVNFILNALESMPDGGTLTLTTTRINANGRRFLPGQHVARSLIRVDIQDTGSGIAPDDLAKVFDPFFSTKSDGTGLGLAVSHGIIEEHGATIDVESKPNKGTTFHLLFELITQTTHPKAEAS